MHGHIHPASDQCFLDFLNEQTFSTNLGERPVANRVACGCYHHDLHGTLDPQFLVRGRETRTQFIDLGQG